MQKRSIAGTSSTYIEGLEKVTGRCKYTFDLELPRMLAARFLYPDYPHARITRLDTSAAEALPGVAAVVTHRDLPGEKIFGYIVKDQPAFAIDEVCYIGDIVAAVAAENDQIAEEALHLIEVEYEPLDAVFDPLAARGADSPPARLDLDSNILAHTSFAQGDVEAGFAEADVIVEHEYHTGAIEQMFLETEGALADWDGDTLTIYAGGQHPHRDRIQIAEQLGLPANRVRVVYPYVGGGFGGKDELHTQVQVGLLALKTGRPVKLIRSRHESMYTHVKRHCFSIRYKTGVKKDGAITAIEVEAILDAGPYTNASLAIMGFACEMSSGPYKVPHARVNGYTVATNNLAGGAMRGFGGPEMAFAQEQNLDLAAEKIGMDPLEFRLKNAMEKGTLMPTGARIHHESGLKKTLARTAEVSAWEDRGSWLERQPAPHLRRGLGMAAIWHGMSIGRNLMDYGRATLEMTPDGSLTILSGTAEIGSGSRTAQTMIAAEALGISPEQVRIAPINTDVVPDAGPTTASRSTYIIGNAILEAAQVIRHSLLEVASDELEAAPDDLELAEGVIRVKGAPGAQITIKEAAYKAWDRNKPLRAEGHHVYWDPGDPPEQLNYPVAHTVFVIAVHIAQVLVDIETGQVRVEKIWAGHDVGKAINMLGIEGQIDGGIMQGVGTALMEELQIEGGRLMNASMEGYLVPSIMDAPQVEAAILETPQPTGPLGAVGIGESTLNPTAAAIANAIHDAAGVRVWQMPMTPERVLAALRKEGQSVWF